MLETKNICSSFLIDSKQIGGEFQNKKVFLVTLAVLVYSFNNLTTTLLWNSSNTTDDALLQCLCLSFLVPAPLHTYIHTLLARPHGAFQSQFYITKL